MPADDPAYALISANEKGMGMKRILRFDWDIIAGIAGRCVMVTGIVLR